MSRQKLWYHNQMDNDSAKWFKIFWLWYRFIRHGRQQIDCLFTEPWYGRYYHLAESSENFNSPYFNNHFDSFNCNPIRLLLRPNLSIGIKYKLIIFCSLGWALANLYLECFNIRFLFFTNTQQQNFFLSQNDWAFDIS